MMTSEQGGSMGAVDDPGLPMLDPDRLRRRLRGRTVDTVW